MIFLLGIRWWYTAGWLWAAHEFLLSRVIRVMEFFSVTELLKTLFAPFRQDVVSGKGRTLEAKLVILGNNLISRFFGLLIRSMLIIAGVVAAMLATVFGLLSLVIWPLLPLLPIIAIVLMSTGFSL